MSVHISLKEQLSYIENEEVNCSDTDEKRVLTAILYTLRNLQAISKGVYVTTEKGDLK